MSPRLTPSRLRDSQPHGMTRARCLSSGDEPACVQPTGPPFLPQRTSVASVPCADVDVLMHPLTVELASLPASGADLPFFLHGESMGGAVAILAAASGRFGFDGAVLVAPMCALDKV